MNVELVFTFYELKRKAARGKLCIVIDSLRAASSIIAALDADCKEVVPAVSIKEAYRLQGFPSYQNYLLCGEIGGLRPEGFVLGNSPLDYQAAAIRGKGIIMATTNGTRALRLTAGAKLVLVAALINAKAVAMRLTDCDGDLLICCAGTKGEFSIEDFVTAGKLVHELYQCRSDILADDATLSAYQLYLKAGSNKQGLVDLFCSGNNGKRLIELDLVEDIEFCAVEDQFTIVPYFDGIACRKD
ncbi:MAG: 2-phosphosulfolactate phosphatase [Dethiobacteria bacterium]|jgi:2-phosphosulfolactate phosphatase|nr:2-phosphosulfolactate phosphatase [Bacillota bacterium]